MEPPLNLLAFEFRKHLAGGRTRPMLFAAMDEQGNQRVVVLKLRRPAGTYGTEHLGATSLACELISAVLARSCDLSVPDYAIVDVPPELAEAVPDSAVRDSLKVNPGLNFGSVFVQGMDLWRDSGATRDPALLEFFEQLMQFDAALINGDRTVDKSNVIWRGSEAYAIDHSLALPIVLWDHGSEKSTVMLPESNIRRHAGFPVLRDAGRTFDSLLNQLPGCLSPDRLAKLRAWIPASWEEKAGHLDRIFEFLGAASHATSQASNELRRVVG